MFLNTNVNIHFSLLQKKNKRKNGKNELICELRDKKLVIKVQAPESEEKILLPCPFHCEDTFAKKNDLYGHLKKVHNVSEDFAVELQYYCAVANCVYNVNSGSQKCFSGRKFLNQHHNKVHLVKGIVCKDCNTSFSIDVDYQRHKKTCNFVFICQICNVKYSNNEALLVHLMRKHPDVHKMYKNERKAEKRRLTENSDQNEVTKVPNFTPVTTYSEKQNTKTTTSSENLEFKLDSPKKASTQVQEIANDVTLLSWPNYEPRTDDNSTQTFENTISMNEDMYFPEIISLSDIQTQTLEFGLSKSNKETQIKNSETQSPDLSIKETQTCFCHHDAPKTNFRLFENLTSTETQTQSADRFSVKSDVLLSFNSAETQTCFDDSSNDSL